MSEWLSCRPQPSSTTATLTPCVLDVGAWRPTCTKRHSVNGQLLLSDGYRSQQDAAQVYR